MAVISHAQHGTEHHGQQDRKHRGNSPVLQAAERDIRADHDDVAMGKVQHFRDAVNHRVAQGDNGVDAPQAQPVDQVVKKNHTDCFLSHRIKKKTSETGPEKGPVRKTCV